MKENLNIDFNKLTEIEKSLFMYVYFKQKAEGIIAGMARINSSRDKDEECYRWRFANNEALVCETELLKFKISKMQQKLNVPNYENAVFDAVILDGLIDDYKNHLVEKERVEAEREMFAEYGINFNDLMLSFDEAKKLFETLPDDEKKAM